MGLGGLLKVDLYQLKNGSILECYAFDGIIAILDLEVLWPWKVDCGFSNPSNSKWRYSRDASGLNCDAINNKWPRHFWNHWILIAKCQLL